MLLFLTICCIGDSIGVADTVPRSLDRAMAPYILCHCLSSGAIRHRGPMFSILPIRPFVVRTLCVIRRFCPSLAGMPFLEFLNCLIEARSQFIGQRLFISDRFKDLAVRVFDKP